MAFAEASPDTIHSDEDLKRLKTDIWANLTKYGNLSEAFEKVVKLNASKYSCGPKSNSPTRPMWTKYTRTCSSTSAFDDETHGIP